MAPKTRSGKEVEEAAVRLMQVADLSCNASEAEEDKADVSNEMRQETSENSEQQVEGAENLLLFSQAAVVHPVVPWQIVSATASQSGSANQSQSVTPTPSQPVSTSTSQTVSRATSRSASATSSQTVSTNNTSASTSASTPTLTAASMAALTVEQRTLQQTRFAMTSQECAALGLKVYRHYDLSNNQIGTLLQTKNENRTFRQTQRRLGAVRLRPGTTTGLKFPHRRRA